MRVRGSDRGAAAVEFALVLPLLILLVFGITEFGRAYHVQTTISQAAREGVRTLALSSENDARAITRLSVRDAAGTLSLDDNAITVSPSSCVGKASPTNASVTVEANVRLIFFGDLTLTGRGTMRCNG